MSKLKLKIIMLTIKVITSKNSSNLLTKLWLFNYVAPTFSFNDSILQNTTWILSTHSSNFLSAIVASSRQRAKIKLPRIDDQWWTGGLDSQDRFVPFERSRSTWRTNNAAELCNFGQSEWKLDLLVPTPLLQSVSAAQELVVHVRQ